MQGTHMCPQCAGLGLTLRSDRPPAAHFGGRGEAAIRGTKIKESGGGGGAGAESLPSLSAAGENPCSGDCPSEIQVGVISVKIRTGKRQSYPAVVLTRCLFLHFNAGKESEGRKES